mgnify:CR=1 FL=1
MIFALNAALLIAALAISLPLLMFCLEVFLSLLPPRRQGERNSQNSGTLAVLLPAHNEALVLGGTLTDFIQTTPDSPRVVCVP